jgi:hypothetical protein
MARLAYDVADRTGLDEAHSPLFGRPVVVGISDAVIAMRSDDAAAAD